MVSLIVDVVGAGSKYPTKFDTAALCVCRQNIFETRGILRRMGGKMAGAEKVVRDYFDACVGTGGKTENGTPSAEIARGKFDEPWADTTDRRRRVGTAEIRKNRPL